MTRAFGVWCEFRDVIAAFELGVEEFCLVEKCMWFYFCENEMCYKYVMLFGDFKVLEIVLNKYLDYARNFFVVAVSSVKEIECYVKECVLVM